MEVVEEKREPYIDNHLGIIEMNEEEYEGKHYNTGLKSAVKVEDDRKENKGPTKGMLELIEEYEETKTRH